MIGESDAGKLDYPSTGVNLLSAVEHLQQSVSELQFRVCGLYELVLIRHSSYRQFLFRLFLCGYYIHLIYIYLWKVSRISPNWLTNRLCSLHFNGFPDDFCINEIISSNLSSERTCQCFNWMLQWWMLQLLNKYRKIMSKHQQCLFSECKLVANLDNLITFSPQ